jgi:signal peptidase I
MAPTLEDQDRLIVNKFADHIGDPRRGDIVMLYYPLDPDKSFVKRVIAEENDMVRVVDGRVFVNDVPVSDDYVAPEYRDHDEWGPQVIPEGYYFVMRPSQQQLRQPPLGLRAEEIHHRPRPAPLVADSDRARVLADGPRQGPFVRPRQAGLKTRLYRAGRRRV